MDVRVPPLGEGADSGTVLNVTVKVGDAVKSGQTLIELENEKAVAPIPSTQDGVVTKLYVKVGDTISVGQPIVALGAPGASATVPAAKETPASAPAPQAPAAPAEAPASRQPGDFVYESKSGLPPPASPSIRRLAQEIGLDLAKVKGSQAGGRITLEDVKAHVAWLQAAAFGKKQKPEAESVDFSKWGPVVKKPISSLRKTIGQRMTESWTTIPHVTQHDEADITELMKLRKRASQKGSHLTLIPFILKAVVSALKEYPFANASLDETTNELVEKSYYHIGIAVDTESGLIVPVIRNVDQKTVWDLAKELADLSERTRQRKVSLEELKGGTFTISNIGSIGGGFFTPIINKPEAAILGVGKGVAKARPAKEGFESRSFLPLSLSYDHRIIDGADGARLLKHIVTALEKFSDKDIA